MAPHVSCSTAQGNKLPLLLIAHSIKLVCHRDLSPEVKCKTWQPLQKLQQEIKQHRSNC
jgi:hypothetical protein